jgi:hypothetical protein
MWHFIIPFYYGKNEYVLLKGGAPVARKVHYLRQTVSSIQRLGVDARITIFVCNEVSREKALEVHPQVELLDCLPFHLPMQTVLTYRSWFEANGAGDDIVVFNEDDQIIYLSNTVKQDIATTTDRVVFSPHRWARQFLRFRRKGRPIHYLNGLRGILDNVDPTPGEALYSYRHRYLAQRNRNAAYAACWFMKGSLFRSLPFAVPEPVELETASYMVFDTGIPVLKPHIDGAQNLSDFMVDHLSGYDYNRRLVKFFPKK